MDTTLAINPGSSSKKYAFFRNGTEIFSVRFERIGEEYGKCISVGGIQQKCEAIPGVSYEHGLVECIKNAIAGGVISHVNDITTIGVRIVAPHTFFTVHRRVDGRFMEVLESVKTAAPLHVPHILEELYAARKEAPHAALIGVSDSAFHTSMPTHASLYSVSERDREAHQLFRFGFHGLSVASVVREAERLAGGMPGRMVVVHAGSGVSITALREGKSVDTTMGFGPASGLIMSSRGGDIDAVALLHLQREKKLTSEEMEEYLSLKTGLMGLANTNDLRIVLDRARRGENTARVAEAAFFYHIHKAMNAYAGILGGVDALVLTATAVERNPYVRSRISSGFAHLGCALSKTENEMLIERTGKISHEDSPIPVFLIVTSEMAEIARSATNVK